jgi:hypothetical protein
MKKLKIKKAILTHSSGPQTNLKQLFFVITQSQKLLPAYTGHLPAKIKWCLSGPNVTKNNFLFQPPSPLPIDTS